MKGRLRFDALQKPMDFSLISIGKRFNFHWKTIQLPLENDLISIGKRSALGVDVLQRLVGAVGKAALMGAQ